MIPALLTLGLLLITALLIQKFYLSAEDLSKYDVGTPLTFTPEAGTPGMKEVEQFLTDIFNAPKQGSRKEQLVTQRALFDSFGTDLNLDCEHKKDRAEFGGEHVAGEWTIVPGADPDRRILYLHGGAFTLGSDVSHRGTIYNLARRTGCVVFAPDYRLMPENKRLGGVIDCQTCYQWILKNGPHGPESLESLAVAGDSAGGNLTLRTINWARDKGLRQADAVAALSPVVDMTYSAPSIRGNLNTDLMLRPIAAMLAKFPDFALLWIGWAVNRISPSDPRISPIFDDLSELPPTIVQASGIEILYDDARRYAEKRRVCGSPVTLQTWDNMCHVWQAFADMVPEGHDALDEIAAFFKENGAAAPGWITSETVLMAGE